MADDATPDPNDPRTTGPDPDDADLVAYLDGELDEPDARAVEDRLTSDSTARAQAAAFKKTYDLLDYLPKPEPSPDFATRTLTRIQPTFPASPSGSAPVSAAQRPPLAVPTPSTSAASAMVAPASQKPWWIGGLIWALAAVACLGGGFAGHAGLRPILEPPVKENDDLPIKDIRTIEALPLYLGVDDLDFVRKLDDPDLFAHDHVLLQAPTLKGEPAHLDNRDKLIGVFKSFPPARQQQLRQLDQQIHDLPADEQERLGRVLETYAVWLDRLPDLDRRRVLMANTPSERLVEVRQTKEKYWQDGLPQRQKEQLKVAGDPEVKVGLLERWKQADRVRREEWGLARRNYDEIQGGGKPWPFSDPVLAAQVDDYVKAVFKVDLAKSEPKFGEVNSPVRLTREEYVELKSRHEAAKKDGLWFLYGVMVYRLSLAHPGLPEPGGDKGPMTDIVHPSDLSRELRKKGVNFQQEKKFSRGKWPEFALEVTETCRKINFVHEPFGPCKPGAFTEPVNLFLVELQQKKLAPAERERLKKDEGKWPEYPRLMIELAREHNLPVPGATLPGAPQDWQKYYSLKPIKKK